MTRVDDRINGGAHSQVCPPYCGPKKPPYQIIQLPKVPPQECGTIYNAAGAAVGQTGLMCTSPGTPATPPATTPPATGTPMDFSVDGILEWVKANPLIAAGVAAAAFFMFKK